MLKGKKAIIIGGTRGIGFAITEELIRQGADAIICSRTTSQLKSATDRLKNKGQKVYGITVNAAQYSQCKKLVNFALRKFGKIDILINNAGIYGPIGKLEENNFRHWHETIKINLLGMVYCSQLVIPIMKKQKSGKIINLCGGGVGSVKPPARFSAYFTSKMAVAGFTEVVASELDSFNIQVNCISPGGVNTFLTDYLIKQGPGKAGKEMYDTAVKQKLSGGIPPILTAQLVSFLCSEKSNHITGRLLSVKWNPVTSLEKNTDLSDNLYKLRRIDDYLFHEKQRP